MELVERGTLADVFVRAVTRFNSASMVTCVRRSRHAEDAQGRSPVSDDDEPEMPKGSSTRFWRWCDVDSEAPPTGVSLYHGFNLEDFVDATRWLIDHDGIDGAVGAELLRPRAGFARVGVGTRGPVNGRRGAERALPALSYFAFGLTVTLPSSLVSTSSGMASLSLASSRSL